MAQWKRLSSEPITAERWTAVYDDLGRNGRAGVRWNQFQQVELYGPVVRVDEKYDDSGAVTSENSEVLDENPTF